MHKPANTPVFAAHSAYPIRAGVLFGCIFLLTAAAQAQAIYRIVGPDGKVTFSDRPVDGKVQTAPETTGSAAAGNAASAQLPYALRQTASRYPVTLYAAKDCQPCDEARNYLHGRGVPFSERTVETEADAAALKKLSGQDGLPFATIGSQHLKGFAQSHWAQYLDAAGYPAQSSLPASYRTPAPRPLTTPPAAAAAPTAPAAPKTEAPSPPAPQSLPPGTPTMDNPAGLRF